MDITRLEELIVNITLKDGAIVQATNLYAIELIMAIKPSAFEGLRLRWPKMVWAFHNLVAHPLMHILVWCHLYKLAFKLHDASIPKPLGIKLPKTASKK